MSLSIPVPSYVVGDLIFVWSKGFAHTVDEEDPEAVLALPTTPGEAVAVASVADETRFHQVFVMRATADTPPSIELTTVQPVDGWTGFADVLYNIDWENGPIEVSQFDFVDNVVAAGDPMPVIVPLVVDGTDRLAMVWWWGQNSAGVHSDDVNGPAEWDHHADRAVDASTGAQKVVTRSLAVDEDVIAIDATSAGGYTYSFGAIVFIGPDTPVVPPVDPAVAPALQVQPDRLRLGCAETYNVYITDDTYENILDVARFSDISWERVEDDVSSASATFPDELGGVLCVAKLGGLRPWKHGLLIERNDQQVWNGPIVNVGRAGNAIHVTAGDVLARYRKRFLLREIANPASYTNVDAGRLFHDIITTHAFQPSDRWTPTVPLVQVGSPVTRTLRPREFKYAWDMLHELLDTSLDAYVMNGTLYVWEPNAGWRYQARIKRTLEGPYNANFDLVYGTFTEESFSQRADWTIDGMGQANFVAVPATETGEHAFRSYEAAENVASQAEYGVLDMVDPDQTERPEDKTPTDIEKALQVRADTLLAMRALPPAIIEGGVLSEDAPIDMNHLRPGSIWRLDVFDVGYGQLLQAGRLKRVSVRVTVGDEGIREEITPTLYPPGWQGEV